MSRHSMAKSTLWALALCALGSSSIATAADRHGYLVSLLTGAYDNNEQVWQQNEDDLPLGERRHYVFAATDDANTLTFAVGAGQSADAPGWQFTFATRDERDDGGAVYRISTIAPLGDSGRTCDWRWLPQGEGYRGSPVPRSRCDRSLPAAISVDSDFLRVEYGRDAADQARRVIFYRGWISMKRQRIDPEAGDDDYLFMRDLTAHNEGFKTPLLDKDGAPSGYTVELARLTQQTTQAAVLKIGVIEDATGKTLRYAWADPFADRIGINLRWFTSGWTRIETAP
ncbi:MAG: hypothetical protein AAGI15_15280 [Pseudomonadota bacterium]